MKALTIWQPWASLIMIGAKPYEFRRWDYRTREPSLEGERTVIHAGARPVKLDEVEDVIDSYRHFGVLAELADPLLQKVRKALEDAEDAMPAYRSALALYRRAQRRPRFVGDPVLAAPEKPNGQILPLGFALGTARLLRPRRCTELFGGGPDSDRVDHHMWAWPLTDIHPFMPPIEARGAQGFWTWNGQAEAA